MGGASAKAPAYNDGMTADQRKKNDLENNPEFKTYLMMKKMRIPLHQIRGKIKTDGKGFKENDIDLFASKDEIEEANYML